MRALWLMPLVLMLSALSLPAQTQVEPAAQSRPAALPPPGEAAPGGGSQPFLNTARGAECLVRIDAAKILAAHPAPLGLNVNYLLDGGALGGKMDGPSLAKALKSLHVKWLRYPGGEEADGVLWAPPPFTKPQPTLVRNDGKTWPQGDAALVDTHRRFVRPPLDFDQFIAVCREAGAEPVVVVCYDALYPPDSKKTGQTGADAAPVREQLLAAAAAWVKYANVTRGYRVKYWEIGNESWRLRYNGGARAQDYARDVRDFSRAMKAVDPSLQIGANGPSEQSTVGERDRQEKRGDPWWQVVLENSASEFDYAVVHDYPCYGWGGFEGYAEHGAEPLAGVLDRMAATLKYWAPDRPDLKVAVAQTNSADWRTAPAGGRSRTGQGGWQHANNLGHALALLDILSSYAAHPKLLYACVWGTRWLKNATAPELWDTLDAGNRPLPTGEALRLADQLLDGEREMLATEAPPAVRAVAVHAPKTGALDIVLVNRTLQPQEVRGALLNAQVMGAASVRAWSGSGPEDAKPEWSDWQALGVDEEGAFHLTLPPASLAHLQAQVKANLPGL